MSQLRLKLVSNKSPEKPIANKTKAVNQSGVHDTCATLELDASTDSINQPIHAINNRLMPLIKRKIYELKNEHNS